MSAFLGPIHYWVFNKVILQEELIQDIIKASGADNWDDKLEDKLSEAYGTIENKPLEDVIDYNNIHGWLQGRISVTEGRLSLAAAVLLKADPKRKEDIIRIAYEFGEKHPISEEADTEEAFKAICDSLIDGMPCDGVNEVLEQGEAYTSWQQTACVHAGYWEQVGESVSVYYELRKAIIEGMLRGTRLTFNVKEDSIFEIVRQ
ncbi:hypothetical protein [Anaerocolumna xylanovorans]|uniref:Uncharacterized protein n=1 Tax=Anaerocolumna xylanovorans DSM 12503 TaxID=1121345 RepID=A0A1M7XWU5_9FIRM|nr:hypothetical protein [Anaerocolumna xylanovorans]SHO43293.1 hypothetical protein SAMN02745217_00164 [Anaerocolumna xylanovorans DSM 12503]